jgi:hypothetical protein
MTTAPHDPTVATTPETSLAANHLEASRLRAQAIDAERRSAADIITATASIATLEDEREGLEAGYRVTLEGESDAPKTEAGKAAKLRVNLESDRRWPALIKELADEHVKLARAKADRDRAARRIALYADLAQQLVMPHAHQN